MTNLEAASRGDLALYNTREAAEYLRCSASTVRRLIRCDLLVPDMRGGTDNRKSHIFKLKTLETHVDRAKRLKR